MTIRGRMPSIAKTEDANWKAICTDGLPDPPELLKLGLDACADTSL